MNDSDQYEQINLRLFIVSPPVPLRKTAPSTAAASWGTATTAAASTDRLPEQYIQLVV